MMQRLVAGLTGLAIVLPIIVWGATPGVAVLIGVVTLIALDEYARMAAPADVPVAWGILLASTLLVAVWVVEHDVRLLLLTVPLTLVAAMFLVPDVQRAGEVGIRLAVWPFYVPLMLSAVLPIRDAGVGWVFFLMASTWLGDTGAYFAGRRFGRTPLFPRVSPKKTVEGVIGGALVAVAGALVFKGLLLPTIGWVEAAVLALVLDLAGVVGDLVESMLKRAWGVKDSGWIMPGHGGILDRIDSLLFTAPLLYVWLRSAHPDLWLNEWTGF